jgi:hypothetical protein
MFKLTIVDFPVEAIAPSFISNEAMLHSIGVFLLNMFRNKDVGYMRFIEFNNRYDGGRLFCDKKQTHVSLDVTFNYLYKSDTANNIRSCLKSPEDAADEWYSLTVDFGKGGKHVLQLSPTPLPEVYFTLLSPSELVHRCSLLENSTIYLYQHIEGQTTELDTMSEEIAGLALKLEQEKKLNSDLASRNFNLVDKLELLIEKTEEKSKIQSTCLSLLQRQVNALVDKLSSKNILDDVVSEDDRANVVSEVEPYSDDDASLYTDDFTYIYNEDESDLETLARQT